MFGKLIKRSLCIVLAAMLCGCAEISSEIPPETVDSVYSDDTVWESVTEETMEEYTETASVTEVTMPSEPDYSVISRLEEIEPADTESSLQITYITMPDLSEYTASSETSVKKSSQHADITVVTKPETTQQTETVTTTVQTTVTEAFQTEQTTTQTERQEYYPVSGYNALNFGTQKAMWISYLEYERIMRGHTEAEFTAMLDDCMDNIAALGCNTVYFQVRAYGDAYYDSKLFPTGDRLGGSIGGNADYDPLAIAVKSAHDRGISIHAWVNPMRLMTDSQLSSLSDDYVIKKWYNDSSKCGRYIVKYDGRWYLSPAYADTAALICAGISEIMSAYNVDGIQIDDYFYPTTDTYFDADAYAASGTSLSLADWRRSIVSEMVSAMYRTVHSVNPTAVFGISPQGNYNNNYNSLYADTEKWCAEYGYCDYICPQIYYGFDNAAMPFEQTAAEWKKYASVGGKQLVIGLAAYKAGSTDSYAGAGKTEWKDNSDILARQRRLALDIGAGYAFFRYDCMFFPDSSSAAAVNAEIENLRKN